MGGGYHKTTSSGKENKFCYFLVGVQLIHILMQAYIICTTTGLFFFPLLDLLTNMNVLSVRRSHGTLPRLQFPVLRRVGLLVDISHDKKCSKLNDVTYVDEKV